MELTAPGDAGQGFEHLAELWVFLFTAQSWTWWPLRAPSNWNDSMILNVSSA